MAPTFFRRAVRAVMKSHRVHLPSNWNFPLRFRFWFCGFTAAIMVILAVLGFSNLSHGLPINAQILHFTCFFIATAVFYFIVDVDEDARRIWFWRYAGLMLTGFCCIICGGIFSEIVKSMLPYKQFSWFDLLANLFGSSLGLYVGYILERYYRYRREIARLYRPLDSDPLSDDELNSDDEAILRGTQLLPTHTNHNSSAPGHKPQSGAKAPAPRLNDVWDEREELFGVGDDDDEEEDEDWDRPKSPGAPKPGNISLR